MQIATNTILFMLVEELFQMKYSIKIMNPFSFVFETFQFQIIKTTNPFASYILSLYFDIVHKINICKPD